MKFFNLFKLAPKIKYMRINLTKHVQDLHTDNREKLKANKWRHRVCLWVGKLSPIRMEILPKLVYRFSTIPIKMPMAFFVKHV